jgi:hypothetical protein
VLDGSFGPVVKHAALLLLIPLAACAQPFESRVAGRLAEAGLPGPIADCMARRWVDRLNVVQLQKLSGLAEDLAAERAQGRLTAGRFVERVRALNDREILEVVTTSSVACVLAG